VRIRQNEHNVRVQLDEIDDQSRADEANREAGLHEQIKALAKRLRGEM